MSLILVIFYISFDHLETAWHLAFFGFTSANLTWALMVIKLLIEDIKNLLFGETCSVKKYNF